MIVMNENVMELAHRLAVESDPKRYSFRVPIFGATVTWKKAIEKEYYGLEDYEVEILGDRMIRTPGPERRCVVGIHQKRVVWITAYGRSHA